MNEKQLWRDELKKYSERADITFYSRNSPYINLTVNNIRLHAHWIGPKDTMYTVNWTGNVIVKLLAENLSVVIGEKKKSFHASDSAFCGEVIASTTYGYIIDVGFLAVIDDLSVREMGLRIGDTVTGDWLSPILVYTPDLNTDDRDLQQWNRFLEKETCPMCQHPRDDFFIADLEVSKLYLSPNQRWLGYVYTVYNDHKTDLHQLSESENDLFYKDALKALHAVNRAFFPDKMNIDNLGNKIPHLHWHIVPRYIGDDNWRNPMWADWYDGRHIHLSAGEYQALIRTIKNNL